MEEHPSVLLYDFGPDEVDELFVRITPKEALLLAAHQNCPICLERRRDLQKIKKEMLGDFKELEPLVEKVQQIIQTPVGYAEFLEFTAEKFGDWRFLDDTKP